MVVSPSNFVSKWVTKYLLNGAAARYRWRPTSPRNRAVLVRERARRTVRADEREAHSFTCALFDRARAPEVVKIGRGKARTGNVDLDVCRLEFNSEGQRDRVQGRFRRAVGEAENIAVREARVRVQRQRAGRTPQVDDAPHWGFPQERQHRLGDGDNAEHICLEDCPHIVERPGAWDVVRQGIVERRARLPRVRDTRVVHEHIKSAELVLDVLCRGGDGGLICDIDLKGAGIRSDALCGCLPILEVARPDKHGEAVCREILRDLKTDSFIGPGDQGDGVVLHSNLLFCIDVWSTPLCCAKLA